MLPRLVRLLAATAMAASGWLGAASLGAVPAAAADQCLPPPQVLLSEVARVAGTGSKLWADIQAVEDADAAAGVSGPGQVLQDMLGAASKDGYVWDCGSSQLTAPLGAPPRTDLPPDTTPVPAPGKTTVAGDPNPGSSNLAAPVTTANGGRGTTPYGLIALAVASAVLIVVIVRSRMARH